MRVAYVRVSSADQNEARQVEALKEYNVEKWFTEKCSGKDTDRPKLREMLEFIREGDEVYVSEFSRLARNTRDLLDLAEMLEKKKVSLISHKEKLDSSNPSGKLMLTVIAAIAEFERDMILERQREGIALAKERGVYKGRAKIKIDDFGKYYEKYMRREYTKTSLAETLGITRVTLNRLIREYKEEHGL